MRRNFFFEKDVKSASIESKGIEKLDNNKDVKPYPYVFYIEKQKNDEIEEIISTKADLAFQV